MQRPALSALLLLLAATAITAGCGGGSRPGNRPDSARVSATSEATGASKAGAAFDAQAALGYVRVLAADIGSRPSGSDAERRAADYLRGQLHTAGYRVEMQAFRFAVNRDASVQVTEFWAFRGVRAVNGALALQGAATGTAVGEVRSIGQGRPEDIPAGGLRGFVAVAERGGISFGDKARNAQGAGAIALVVVNQTSEQTIGTLGWNASIPVVGVPREAAALLREAEATNVPVTVRIDALSQRSDQNVIARPPNGECAVVLGAHYDSVDAGPGANDNASGVAVVLAVAEARAARSQQDGVCYVLFGGEELGLRGSLAYAESLPERDLQAMRGMINLDMVGTGDTWNLIGSPSLQELGMQVFRSLGVSAKSADQSPEFDSDYSPFLRRGVPAIFLNRSGDRNYHSANDRLEFVRPELLAQAGALAMGLIDRLLGTP